MPDYILVPAASSKNPILTHFAPPHEGARHPELGKNDRLPPETSSTWQPQDGITRSLAAEVRSIQAHVAAKLHAATDYHIGSRLLSEPEDARLTGGTRSLMRRVLGLNVPKPPQPIKALRPARVA